MAIQFSDNALTTLATSINNVATTLTVAAATGDGFPQVTGGGSDYFVLTMEDASGNREFIRVDHRAAASDVMGSGGYPLQRGYWGSTARSWAAGDGVDCRWTAEAADQFYTDALAAGAAAAAGQTLAFGQKTATTTGLTYGYYGGQLWVDGVLTTIADGTVALTASQTNYVERTHAGAVSTNTGGFTAGRVPLQEVVTSAGAVTSVLDRRIPNTPFAGRLSKSVAGGADVTLSAEEARNHILEFTGVLIANINVILPTTKLAWVVKNGTTGSFTLTVKPAAGTGVAVTQGYQLPVYCDGTNVLSGASGAFPYTVGVAAGNLVQLDGTAKLPAVDGSQLTNLPSLAATVTADCRNLIGKRNVANPNFQADYAADEIVVKNPGGTAVVLSAFSATVDITASGVNGLDTGAEGANAYYYVWAIYDGANKKLLLSTSSTAPTMPGSYTYKGLIGVIRNDGSSNFVDFWQTDRDIWLVEQNVFTGQAGVTSYTLQSLSAQVPPNAKEVDIAIGSNGGITNRHLSVAGNSAGTLGAMHAGISNSVAYETWIPGARGRVPLATAQTVYWRAEDTNASYRMSVYGYKI